MKDQVHTSKYHLDTNKYYRYTRITKIVLPNNKGTLLKFSKSTAKDQLYTDMS